MRVRMKTLMAGPDGVRKPDAVYDLPTAEAQALIDGGYAVKVEKADKPEAASAPRAATRSRGRTADKPEAADADPGVNADEAQESQA